MLLHLSKFNLLPTVLNLSRGNPCPLKMFRVENFNVENENVYLGKIALTAVEARAKSNHHPIQLCLTTNRDYCVLRPC